MDFDHAADGANRPQQESSPHQQRDHEAENKTPDSTVRNTETAFDSSVHSPTDIKGTQEISKEDLDSFDPFGMSQERSSAESVAAAPTDRDPVKTEPQSENLLEFSAGYQDSALKPEERKQEDIGFSDPIPPGPALKNVSDDNLHHSIGSGFSDPTVSSADSFGFGSVESSIPAALHSEIHDATLEPFDVKPSQTAGEYLGFDPLQSGGGSDDPMPSSDPAPKGDTSLGVSPGSATTPEPSAPPAAYSADLHDPFYDTPPPDSAPAAAGDTLIPELAPASQRSDSPVLIETTPADAPGIAPVPTSDPVPAEPPAPYINPDPFQDYIPPVEEKELGDHQPARIPSPSSMDAEPPTPVERSELSSLKAGEHGAEPADVIDKLPLEALRNRDVQEALAAVIPPAPDKPLPPTPSSRPRAPPSSGCFTLLPVMEILLWRDPKKSGAAFATGLVLLFSMIYCSFISVVAYFALALLTVTLGFRLYKTVLGMVQKTNDGHPFQDLLSVDTTVTPEKGHELADRLVAELNCTSTCLKDLFLVKDIFESVKFGFVLYLLTYVGAWFNTMTLVIMGYVALFTLPKVYEQNKEKIDEILGQVKEKVADISAKVKAAIPMGKKAAEPVPEEKKEE